MRFIPIEKKGGKGRGEHASKIFLTYLLPSSLHVVDCVNFSERDEFERVFMYMYSTHRIYINMRYYGEERRWLS